MHFRFVVHINWPGSQSKEFESSCGAGDWLVLDKVIRATTLLLLLKLPLLLWLLLSVCGPTTTVVVIVVVCVIGDFNRGTSAEPVKDWSFFTQNNSQICNLFDKLPRGRLQQLV